MSLWAAYEVYEERYAPGNWATNPYWQIHNEIKFYNSYIDALNAKPENVNLKLWRIKEITISTVIKLDEPLTSEELILFSEK